MPRSDVARDLPGSNHAKCNFIRSLGDNKVGVGTGLAITGTVPRHPAGRKIKRNFYLGTGRAIWRHVATRSDMENGEVIQWFLLGAGAGAVLAVVGIGFEIVTRVTRSAVSGL